MSHGHSDNPHLGHHWEDMSQQYGAAKLGMWMFLAQEVLFFSGLFCAYAVLRYNYPDVFSYGYKLLDKKWGAINTVILLISSLTMAIGVRAAQTGNKKQLQLMLILTFLGACGFMGIKTIEYSSKFKKGVVWGLSGVDRAGAADEGRYGFDYYKAYDRAGVTAEDFVTEGAVPTDATRANASQFNPAASAPLFISTASASETPGLTSDRSTFVLERQAELETPNDYGLEGSPPPGLHRFYGIYFFLTGLHGFHVLVGMGLMIWLFIRASQGVYGPNYFTQVDLVGLYWHLVDLIWIFLFPLLYLVE